MGNYNYLFLEMLPIALYYYAFTSIYPTCVAGMQLNKKLEILFGGKLLLKELIE